MKGALESDTATEWNQDTPTVIPSQEFEYPEDSLLDQARELIAKGEPLEPFISQCVEDRETALKAEGCMTLLSFIIDSKKPKLTAFQIAVATGFASTLNLTGPEIAKKLGITKQAFQQGVDAFRKKLNLRKSRCMRSDESRDRMRRSNYRKTHT